jgi:hypothetical protein
VRLGGYVYLESFGGQGRNYLELPPAGYVKHRLAETFEISSYIERRVGPPTIDAVTVRTLLSTTVNFLQSHGRDAGRLIGGAETVDASA